MGILHQTHIDLFELFPPASLCLKGTAGILSGYLRPRNYSIDSVVPRVLSTETGQKEQSGLLTLSPVILDLCARLGEISSDFKFLPLSLPSLNSSLSRDVVWMVLGE